MAQRTEIAIYRTLHTNLRLCIDGNKYNKKLFPMCILFYQFIVAAAAATATVMICVLVFCYSNDKPGQVDIGKFSSS